MVLVGIAEELSQILILGRVTVGSGDFSAVNGNVDYNVMSYTLQFGTSLSSNGVIDDENTMKGAVYGPGRITTYAARFNP